MTKPTILVAGVESVPIKTLTQRLTQGKLLKTDSGRTNWRIATKYYKVEVEVKTLTLSLDKSRSLEDVECEALVLVIDFEQECSFLEVKLWFGEVCDSRRHPVRCLVFIHGNGESTEGEWIQEAKYWALDHGFESIEVSLHDHDLESRLTEEDQGVQRLRSALEAHVWPGYQSTSKRDHPQTTLEAQQEPVDEDQFEKLIVEMSSARERIKSLPDGERREAAAEMAIRLAQYFDEDDDE